MAEFRMPSLGADMEEGTVVEWLVKVGDTVHKGDVVAVVDTAKAAVEVECFDTGVVQRLLVPEGQLVPVGTALAVIGADGAATPSAGPAHEPAHEPVPEPVVAPVAVAPQKKRPVPVSPIVRKIAAQAGLDLTEVPGSGRGGAITRRDVEQAVRARRKDRGSGVRPVSPYARTLAAQLGVDLSALLAVAGGPVTAAEVRALASATAPTAAPKAATATVPPETAAAPQPQRQPATSMRGAIAELMTLANREIPHYHLASTVDMQACVNWLREHNLGVAVPQRLLPAALLLKATALAAARVPELNGHWRDDGFQHASTVDLGVAVSLRGGGLLVPVLSRADELTLTELMSRLKERAGRARAGRPRSSDLGAASITVTNLGDLGVELVHGVIHPPQVALVGFGALLERPWAVGGMLGVRPVVTVTLAADHRATDGAVGARFLNLVDRLLQRPEEL